MKNNKSSSIRVRIDSQTEHELKQLCDLEGTTPSTVIRKLIDDYVNNHPERSSKVDFLFTIKKLPEENPHSWYMFELEVKLQGELNGHDLSKLKVPFLLPEFFEGDKEPFRVDSHHKHVRLLPNCTGKKGRFLGAKVVERIWKGAIYVYEDSLLATPDIYENMVKDAMRKQILLGLSQNIKQIEQIEMNVVEASVNASRSNTRGE